MSAACVLSSEMGDAVIAATRAIYDPCSVAAATPISLYDMGLFEGWSVGEGGELVVRLCITFGACTMAPHFARALEEQLGSLPGVTSVRVDIDPTVMWSTDRMTDTGKSRLESRPIRFTDRDRPRPRQWMETVAG